MEIIMRGRAGGKTHELLRLMAANPSSVMVCFGAASADQTERFAQRLYPDVRWSGRFVSCHEPERLRGRSGDIYVDNVDIVLAALLGRTPAIGTVTGSLS